MLQLSKIIFTSLLITIIVKQSIAQPNKFKFDQIGIEQGLSQTTVYAITQDKYGFMWFGTDDGLNRYDGYSINIFKNSQNDSNTIADNTILNLLSDKNGDLWIGTRRGGLDRYVITENRFFHYKFNSDDSSTINNNNISTIYQDSNGNLWIGTRQGLNLYNPNTDSFIRIYFYNKSSIISEIIPVISICEDETKDFWIGSPGGLFRFKRELYLPILEKKIDDPSSLIKPYYIALESKSLIGEYIRDLRLDKKGNLWTGTFGSGLKRMKIQKNDQRNTLTNMLDRSYAQLGNFIASIYEDSRNNLWIAAYDSGLSVFDKYSETFTKQLNDPIMTLYEDKSGIVWIGTYTSGVKLYDPYCNRFNHYQDNDANDKGKNLITSIVEASDGKLWVATYNSGLKVYSAINQNWKNPRKKISTFRFDPKNTKSISSDKITVLSKAEDGNVWIGTENDGLNFFDKKRNSFIRYLNNPNNLNSIGSNQITSLFYDNGKDLLWIGFLNGRIDCYNILMNQFKHYRVKTNLNPSASVNSVTIIYRGREEALWVGTFEGELNRFNPDTDSFDLINFKAANGSGTLKNGIYSFFEDNDGMLWIGTYGGGLWRFDITKDSIKTYSEVDGLSNNVVYGILPDKSGCLWLSTNKGISRFDPKNETFKVYDARDGLQSNEFNQGAYFGSIKGELFFGGVNGFNAFFPEEIEENNFIPPVYITSFKVFDEILPLSYALTSKSESIELSYSQNFFSFEFTALNYTVPEKNKYAYMLIGFDKEWHTATASQRYASYTNLDPGNYVLRVIGSNNDGVWNEKGTSVIIIINPPFWMTWWFRGIIIISISVIVAATIRYFVRKKIKERTQIMERETALERERLRIARDMHDDLGARLTEIRFLTEIKQTNATDNNDAVLEKISELTHDIISTFDEIVWSVSPQNDTLENLAEFIGQYAVDYLSKVNVRCRLDIPGQIPNIEAPAEIRHNVFLAVKEALNNAVKYSDTHEAHIKFRINNLIVTITIQDFGRGFDLSETNKFGNGLKNMKTRMENIGGSFHIESQINNGTKIILQFPVTKDLLIYD
ncbi:MAG TPA: two-component regulator propeller domain-containing protein [Ignavibacteriaceae bacterium]|jgi:ligand-binding sensor domain-containing protein/signal transduction histidine kinase|nr:MAG: hypothetical protein B6D44_16650 [Ignavibacteriales bacterium UTCHB2]HQF42565.1 two-component regulator propeller domain-containing protein [Ignavibacteriaceae bacterium]